MNEVDGVFQLECNSRHKSDSHVKFKGMFLAQHQKAAVMRAVQNDPNCTGNMVIRNMGNVADERVQIDHGLKDSVDRLVRSKRGSVLSRNLGGMKVARNLNDKVQKLRKVCEDRRFDIALKRHNAREEHIQAHTMLIMSMQWAPDILQDDNCQQYYECRKSNKCRRNNILNRRYIWYVHNEICVIGVWVGKRCDRTAIVGYSVNPSESEEGMQATYEGFQACFFGVFKRLHRCGNSKC